MTQTADDPKVRDLTQRFFTKPSEVAVSDVTVGFFQEAQPETPLTTITQADALALKAAEQATRKVELTPTGEFQPPSDTGVISDIARGVSRTVLNTVAGVALFPRVVVEALPRETPGVLDSLLNATTDRLAGALLEGAQSVFLAPDPEARIQSKGFAFIGEAVTNPAWWSNRFPELGSSAIVAFAPGIAASKLARLRGMTQAKAAQLGQIVSVTTLAASEAGLTFNDMTEQLIRQGVPEAEAREIASRGALAYGITSGLIESNLISFLGRGNNKTILMRIIRGGTGELLEEEAQLIAEAAMVAIVEHIQGVELEPVLTPGAFFESGIGAFSVGGILGPTTARSFSKEEQTPDSTEFVKVVAEITGLTEIQVQKAVGEAADATEPAPKPTPPAVEPPAPTGQAQPAPAEPAAGEAKLPQAVEGAAVEPLSDPQRLRAIQGANQEALRRSQARESRVDDLNQIVAANLPEILSKQQIKSITQRINNATSPKRLRVVIRQIRGQVQKARTQQAQERLRKVVKDLDINTLAPESRAAVESLMDVIDPESLSPQKRAALESLERLVERKGEGAVPARVVKEIERLGKRPISSFSESEATQVADELSRAMVQAKKVRTIRQKRKRRKVKEFVEDAVTEINREKGAGFARVVKAVKESVKIGGAEALVMKLATSQEQASIMESFIELLSGSQHSAMMDVLFDQVFESTNNTLARKFGITDQRDALIEGLGLSDSIGSWLRPESTLVNDAMKAVGSKRAGELQIIELPSGRTIELYRAERADLLAQLLDPETNDLLVFDEVPVKLPGMAGGESITLSSEDLLAIRDSATPDENAFANQAFEVINGQEREDMAESTRKIFGESIVRREGYMPRLRAVEGEQPALEARNFRQRAIKNANITLERNPNDKSNPIVITDIFSRLDNWALQHSAIIELSDSIEQAVAVLNDPSFRTAVRGRHGSQAYTRLTSFYDAIAAQYVGRTGGSSVTDRDARPVFNQITKGLLALRPHVAAYQAASIATMMTELNTADVIANIPQGLNPSLDAEINEHSPMLRERDEGGGSRLVETSAAADKRTLEKFRTNKVKETLMMGMIRNVDRKVIRIIWASSKRQALREGRTGEDLLNRTARIAERVVRRTQPTWDVMSVNGLALDAKTRTFSRILNFFRAQRSKNVDMTKMAITRFSRGQISAAEMTRILALVNIAQPLYIAIVKWAARAVGAGLVGLAATAITGREGDDDENDEEFKQILLDAKSAMITNFVGGDFLDGMINGLTGQRTFDTQLSPVSSLWTLAGRAVSGFSRAAASDRPDAQERMFKNGLRVIDVALTTRGIPAGAVIKPLIRLYDEAQDRQKRPSGSTLRR